MRSKIKDEVYFSEYIPAQTKRIENFSAFYEENKHEWNETQVTSNFYTIFRISCHQFIAQYSAGNTIEEVTKSYLNTINYMVKGWDKDGGYVHMVWMLSIGILLKIDKIEFDKMVALVDRDDLKDNVIDYLIAYRNRERLISDALEFAKPYKGIADATKMSKNEAQLQIKKYLEKQWYRGHSDSYWHGDHKNTEFGIHFGHWSFESAAVTAIMGLDDSGYRDNQYYPKDLVDFYSK